MTWGSNARATSAPEARGERRGAGAADAGAGAPARDPARGRGSRAGAGAVVSVGGAPPANGPNAAAAAAAAAAASAAVAVAQINRAPASGRPQRRRAASAMAHTRPPARSCVRFNGLMDLNRIPSSTHGHDFHSGQSRVVMVRKTEQRTFASARNGEEPKFERVTRETVQTFSGSRSQKSTSEKRDVFKGLPQQLGAALEPQPQPQPQSQPAEDKKASSSKDAEKSQGFSIPFIGKKSAKEEGSDVYSSFAEDCLAAHNSYRAKHDVPPLKLSKKMCQYSEEWAKRLATTGKLEHRPNNEYGENLFSVWSSDPNHKVTGREPVDNWYAEIKNHAFGKEPRDLKTGHFTQVVWKDSRTLGVGMARSRGGNTFVVANYDPPGNFIGNFSTHVPPVGGFSKSAQSPAAGAARQPPTERATAQTDAEMQAEALRLHNELRAKHGVPALALDPELCKYAAEWAGVLSRENRFAHRPESTYGENIYCHWSSDVEAASKIGAKDAIEAWYNEIKDFDFGSEPRSLKSGHFTQVIWKGSRKLGIGRARDGDRVLIVANYDPRGNYMGQFSANVPPPKRP